MRTIFPVEIKDYLSQGFKQKTGEERGTDGALRTYTYLSKKNPTGQRIKTFIKALINTIFLAKLSPETKELWEYAFSKRTIIRVFPEENKISNKIAKKSKSFEKSKKETTKKPVSSKGDLYKLLKHPDQAILPVEQANQALILAVKHNLLNIETFNLLQNADTLTLTHVGACSSKELITVLKNFPKLTKIIINCLWPNLDIYNLKEKLLVLLNETLPKGLKLDIYIEHYSHPGNLLLSGIGPKKFFKLYPILSLECKQNLMHDIIDMISLDDISKRHIRNKVSSFLKTLTNEELKEIVFLLFNKSKESLTAEMSESTILDPRYKTAFKLIELTTRALNSEGRQEKLKLILDVATMQDNFLDLLAALKFYARSRHVSEFLEIAFKSLSKEDLNQLNEKIKKNEHEKTKPIQKGEVSSLLSLSLPKAIENPPPGVVLPWELANPGLEIAVKKTLFNKNTLTLLQNADTLIFPVDAPWNSEDLKLILDTCPKINNIQITSKGDGLPLEFLRKRLSVILQRESLPPGFTLSLNFIRPKSPFEIAAWGFFFIEFDEQTLYKFYRILNSKNKEDLLFTILSGRNLHTPRAENFIKNLSNTELEMCANLLFFEDASELQSYIPHCFENIMGDLTSKLIYLSTKDLKTLEAKQEKYKVILNALSKNKNFLRTIAFGLIDRSKNFIGEFLQLAISELSREQLKELITLIRYNPYEKHMTKTLIDLMFYAKSSDRNEILKIILRILDKDFDKDEKTVLSMKVLENERRDLLLKFAEVCEINQVDTLIDGVLRYETDFKKDLKDKFLKTIESRNQPELTEKTHISLAEKEIGDRQDI